jgi:cytochrome b561
VQEARFSGTVAFMHNTQDGYGAVAKALHWLSALLILGAWLLGQTLDWFPKSMEEGLQLAHVWSGLGVLTLLAARLAWRFSGPMPDPIPSALDPWLARAATAGHLLLYGLLLAVPVAGIVLCFARGEPLSLFGLVEIASPWARDRAFARSVREVHELLANAILLAAALHAAAALAHHYLLGDATLRRMLPQAFQGRDKPV